MANIPQSKYEIEILTPEQRVLADPRGLERVTIIGDFMFRKILKPVPEIIAVEEVNNE